MKLLKVIISDVISYFKNLYSYIYWNSKDVRVTLSCNVSTKAKIGKGCVFTGNTLITDKVEIGNNTYGHNLNIHNALIGSYCSIGPDVKIGLDEHPLNEKSTHPSFYKEVVQKKAIVNDHVWLGTNSVILCGVVIEKHSVIAAGAVVKSNVESFSIYGGVPAKKIKEFLSLNKI
jgi:acetyltransferase-like isoleucine patch superfamily enzyme